MNALLSENIISEVRKENCFDFLRYLFAFSLIIAHFCTITAQNQFWFITGSMRVKAFFTITGFLVTYSFLRRNNNLRSYAVKRAARIIPAYVCCIFFCILLGFAVSSLGFLEFFTSPQTAKYTISNLLMLNWIEPELPCTFQQNIVPEMNGSLWSMKQEVIFYIMVPLLVWTFTKLDKKYILIPLVLFGIMVYNNVPVQMQYFMYFFTGMAMLIYFDIFCKYSKWLMVIALLLETFVYAFDIPYITSICQSLEPVTFGILIIGIAYKCKPLFFFRRFDNITYGLYLYHFPVIQFLIYYGVLSYSTTLCFLLTVVITSVLACLSWFYVEKPLINRCKQIS